MRLGNPAVRRLVRQSDNGQLGCVEEVATYKGVYLKAALFALVTIVAAILTDVLLVYAVANGYIGQALMALGIGAAVSAIVLLVVALVITFVPSTAKWLGFIYVILQGALLGITSLLIDLVYPGISLAAFAGTLIVFLTALLVNSVFKVRISSKFVRGMLVAFISLALVQLIMFVVSFFGYYDYKAVLWIQLIVSALCIIWATLMLFWDLANIDYIVEARADKKFEWIVAFSLVTTLIYLYVEILELLVRLFALFSKHSN